MFTNKYQHTIDDKGRLIIPTECRQELVMDLQSSRPFYVTTNIWDPTGAQEPCLSLWPEEAFLKLTDKLREISGQDVRIRKLKREFFSNTQTAELDKQGRVLLSAELKTYAGIEKDVTLVGADDHLEVWNTKTWLAYDQYEQEDNTSWSETLGKMGF